MLDNLTLEQVLSDWSYWKCPPDPSIARNALKGQCQLGKDLILAIQGVRRCGKSTLLAQIMTSMRLDSQSCVFVNFEDPRLSQDLDFSLLDRIVGFSKTRRPGLKNYYFFFDEIQNVSQWEKWFHARLERPSNNSYVITGSNSTLLSGKLGSALTGRHRTLELFPFDFEEYRMIRRQGRIDDFLEEGGFPRVLTDPDPSQLLREYFSDIIERDVRRHVAARSTQVLLQTVKAVYESAGSELSQRSLAGLLGVTADTVGSYLDACEAAYILLRCPYFTFSERQRTARNRKYYPIDLGMRKSVVTKTGLDRGKNLEACVFLHLRKKFREVCYWRNGGEVDFVTQGENGITPYQVSWEGEKERHEKALKEFYEKYPQANPAVLISRDTIEGFLGS